MRCLAEKKFFFVKCLQLEFNNWFKILDFEGLYSLYNQYNHKLGIWGQEENQKHYLFQRFHFMD